MAFLKKNINGILGTVLFHLLVIVCCMAVKLSIPHQEEETYIIIDPDDFDPEKESETIEKNEDVQMTNEEIDQFLDNLKNTGSNYSSTNESNISNRSVSESDLKSKYEEEFLREKYGENYEENTSKTYEDYIDPSRMQQHESKSTQKNNIVRTGQALVYAELDNQQRGTSFLKVPVFTCNGGGAVVVAITINPDGKVLSTEVLSAKLNADADCLISAAQNAALKSKFSKISGNKTEKGKITYSFVKQ